MNISGLNFSDPIPIGQFVLVPASAVYVIMTHDSRLWHYLYVGQSQNLANRFSQHDKWNEWLKHQLNGGLYFAFLPVPDAQARLNVETKLRHSLVGLPCNQQ